jgi:hypothetical protein
MAIMGIPLTYSAPQATEVTFTVEPTVTSGVPVGQYFTVDVYIDAPAGSAIVGWTIDIKVDPDVLEPGKPIGPKTVWATAGSSGYFLYDWCEVDKPNPTWVNGTNFHQGQRDVVAGTTSDTVEALVGWADPDLLPPGEGASGTGKLVSLNFKSKNETAYSLIEITVAYYYTSLNSPGSDRQPAAAVSGHYNEPPAINMIGHSAWPEHHNHPVSKFGWDITLFTRIRNDGPITTYGKVVFAIVDSSGVPIIPSPETDPIELSPGDPAVVQTVTWTVPDYDRYYVTAMVYVDLDGSLLTPDWTRGADKPKLFTFNVKA